MITQLCDRFQKFIDSTKLEQKNTLERGQTFLELITRISTKDRAIAQSFVNQFDLFDYNDYKTAQDGVRRHQYRHAVRYNTRMVRIVAPVSC